MSAKLIPILLLIILISAACVDSTFSEEIIKKAEKERYVAIVQSDTTALGKYLAPKFVYHQPTGRVANRGEYLQNTLVGNPEITSSEITENQVTIYKNVAISRGIVKIRFTLNNEPGEAELRFLNVWIYEDGRPQLTARQSSFI